MWGKLYRCGRSPFPACLSTTLQRLMVYGRVGLKITVVLPIGCCGLRHEAVEGFATDGAVSVITTYLRSPPPPPALLLARGMPMDTSQINDGRELFSRFDCGRCYAPPIYTKSQVCDVGLEDEAGQTEFNPPSLRGVSQGAAWLHDNRAKELSDVFLRFGHPNASTFDLTTPEVTALVQYRNTL